ncbi:CLPB [Symbiodinium sp. CCMP2456]|nr:CLPB [Symbiodinium sp. CCMP2456]
MAVTLHMRMFMPTILRLHVVRYFANLYIKKPDEGLRAVNKELQAQALQLAGMEEAPLPCCRNVIVGVRDLLERSIEETSDSCFSPVTALLSGEWINESSYWQHDWECQPDLEWQSEWDWQRVWERLFLSSGFRNHGFEASLWRLAAEDPVGVALSTRGHSHAYRRCIRWNGTTLDALTAGNTYDYVHIFAKTQLVPSSQAPVAAPAATVSAGAAAAPVFGVAGGSAAVGATATAVSSWMLALIQVTGSSASVAVPGLTFYYAWKNRHYVEAAIFGALSLALCPYAWRVYCAASSLAKQMAPKPPKPLSSKAPQKIRGGKTKLPRGDFKLKLTDSDPQAHPIELASPLEAGAVGHGSAATSDEKGETELTGADAVRGGGTSPTRAPRCTGVLEERPT